MSDEELQKRPWLYRSLLLLVAVLFLGSLVMAVSTAAMYFQGYTMIFMPMTF